MAEKPIPKSSLAEKELDKAQQQFEAYDSNIRSLTLDRMNMAPKQELEPSHNLSQKEIKKSQDIYLKPRRSIGSREKFNENYRAEYDFSKQYVNFIAENKMIIGEIIEMWTKPFPGMPAEEWAIPVGKPIWAPRYVAEQVKRAKYHIMTMNETVTNSSDHTGQYYGAMAVESIVQRLDAIPITGNSSIFMGATA